MDTKLTIGSGVFLVALLSGLPEAAQEDVRYHPEVFREINHDVSPPLRDILAKPYEGARRVIPLRMTHALGVTSSQPDPAFQTSGAPLVGTTAGLDVRFP